MIREPYQVYPYGATITPENAEFSFKFNGDVAKKYAYQIFNNQNTLVPILSSVPTSKSTWNETYNGYTSFERGGEPYNVFNDEQVAVSVSGLNSLLTGEDYLWRVRLLENKGDWSDKSNTPSMRIQQGAGAVQASDKKVVEGIICGQLEELDSNDFNLTYVSLKADKATGALPAKKARVKRYVSKYNEGYVSKTTSGKLLNVTEEGNPVGWSFVKRVPNQTPLNGKTTPETGATTTVGPDKAIRNLTRQEVGFQNLLLKGATYAGYYFESLRYFSLDEYNNSILSGNKLPNKTRYSVSDIALSENGESFETVSVLFSKGFLANYQIFKLHRRDVYNDATYYNEVRREEFEGFSSVLTYKNSRGEIFSAPDVFTRSELQKIFPRFAGHTQSGEAPLTDWYAWEEVPVYKAGFSSLPADTYDSTLFRGTYAAATEYNFEEEEQLLYEITKNVTTYDSEQLSQYRSGQRQDYPQESTERITRTSAGLESRVTYQTTEDELTNSAYLFTEEEKNNILNSITDSAFYYLEEAWTQAFNAGMTEFSVWKNFYDSNYYYFGLEAKPTPVFTYSIDETESDYKPVVYNSQGAFVLSSRFATFSIADKESFDIKSYYWEVFEGSNPLPIYTSEKQYSRDVRLSYYEFTNGSTFKLRLNFEMNSGAKFSAELENITPLYTPNIGFQAKATYDSVRDCVNVEWPMAKTSFPHRETGGSVNAFGDDVKWIVYSEGSKNYYAKKISPPAFMYYNSISNTEIAISTSGKNFGMQIGFTVNEPIKENDIVSERLISFYQTGENNPFFELSKRERDFYLVINGREVLFEKRGGTLEDPQILSETSNLKILGKIDPFWGQNTSSFSWDYYRAILPSGTMKLPNGSFNYLYDTDCDLNYSRYRLFVTNGDIRLAVYRAPTPPYSAETTGWVLYEHYAINPSANISLEGKVFSKIQIDGPVSISHLEVYEASGSNEVTIDNILKIPYNDNGTTVYASSYSWLPTTGVEPIFIDDTLVMFRRISVNYGKGYSSNLGLVDDGEVYGYVVYREEYSPVKQKAEEIDPSIIYSPHETINYRQAAGDFISRTMIANVLQTDLAMIPETKSYLIRDYGAHNRGLFRYVIAPKYFVYGIGEEKDYRVGGEFSTENDIYLDNYYWVLTSLASRDDGNYAPVENWRLMLNIENSNITHTTQKVLHTGHSKYPKVAIGEIDYLTTSVSALIGDFQRTYVQDADGTLTEGFTYKDTIERLNKWNTFCNGTRPIMMKDVKGNVYIAVLTDSSEAYDKNIDIMPTMVSFSATQIADLSKTSVYGF